MDAVSPGAEYGGGRRECPTRHAGACMYVVCCAAGFSCTAEAKDAAAFPSTESEKRRCCKPGRFLASIERAPCGAPYCV